MKKQNDEVFEEVDTFDASEKTTSECIRLEGERVPVDNGGKSVQDDYVDYVFTSSQKKKKRVQNTVEEKPPQIDNNSYPLYRSHKKSNIAHKEHKIQDKYKEMKRWKKVLLVSLSALLVIILIVFGTLGILIYKGGQQLINEDYSIVAPKIEEVEFQDNGNYVIYKGKKYELNKNITNILFMGIDKRDLSETDVYGMGGQADFIALGAVDTSTGEISFININRDTMTDVGLYSEGGNYIGTEKLQLCLSYAYGDGKNLSCDNTVTSVQRLFYNIPINSYFSLELEGIAALNDSIGGVDVVSPETIYDFVKGETYHLEGALTEGFVRRRDKQAIDSNVKRNERQKVYLEAFMDKFIELTKQDITTPVTLYNESAPYSCTNLNPSKICYLAESVVMSDGLSVEMMSVPGKVKAGKKFAEFYINEEKFYEMFLDVFYNEIK